MTKQRGVMADEVFREIRELKPECGLGLSTELI
jgi:hypothetical protein